MIPINSTIEKAWIEESEIRLKEFKKGIVKAISGQKVFDKINKKYHNNENKLFEVQNI